MWFVIFRSWSVIPHGWFLNFLIIFIYIRTYDCFSWQIFPFSFCLSVFCLYSSFIPASSLFLMSFCIPPHFPLATPPQIKYYEPTFFNASRSTSPMKLLEKTYFWTILFFIFGTVCLGYLNFGGPHHALMSLFFILATFVFFVLIARSPVISRDFRLKAFMRKNIGNLCFV